MKINPRKKGGRSPKSDYPTAGWLNQNHVSLQGMGLEKINPAGKQSDYATDFVSSNQEINHGFAAAGGYTQIPSTASREHDSPIKGGTSTSDGPTSSRLVLPQTIFISSAVAGTSLMICEGSGPTPR